MIASRDADFTLTDTSLSISTGGNFVLNGFPNADLTGGASDNTFTVSGYTGNASLTGSGGNDTVVATRNSDFTLSDDELDIASGGIFTLTGIANANLTGGAGDNLFTVSDWTGNASLTGSGGNDTVLASRDANFVLGDSLMTISTGGTFTLLGIENAELLGGAGDNSFTVTDWTGHAALTGNGGADTIIATRDANFALADDSLSISSGGSFDLTGITNAILTGGASDNTFTVDHWTGTATLTGNGGNDTINATRDANMTLSDTQLAISGGGTFTLAGITNANLTGGAGGHTFNVSGWTGTASLVGNAGHDTVVASRDADFSLTNHHLTLSANGAIAGDFALSGIDSVNLSGGASNNLFDVSGWTGSGSITGGGGSDTLSANRDSNMTLADSQFSYSTGGLLNLIGITNAILTGGGQGHTYTVSGWTGNATLNGSTGHDTVVAARDANFNLSDSQLSMSTGGTITLNDITNAILTGGGGANAFNIAGWSGKDTLSGMGGNDTYNVNLSTAARTSVVDTASSSGDAINITGGAGNDKFTIVDGSITDVGTVTYVPANIGSVSVNGNAGNDTFNFTEGQELTTLNGGSGKSTLNFNAAGNFMNNTGSKFTSPTAATVNYAKFAKINYTNVGVHVTAKGIWFTGGTKSLRGYMSASSTVTAGTGMPIPTGKVQYLLDNKNAGTFYLTSKGTNSQRLLAVGTASTHLTAIYAGNGMYATGSSDAVGKAKKRK